MEKKLLFVRGKSFTSLPISPSRHFSPMGPEKAALFGIKRLTRTTSKRRAPARRGRLRPERQYIVGTEADLLDDGRHRIQGRILASPVSRAGPRLTQPQYVHRCALLDPGAYRQTTVRQLNRSI